MCSLEELPIEILLIIFTKCGPRRSARLMQALPRIARVIWNQQNKLGITEIKFAEDWMEASITIGGLSMVLGCSVNGLGIFDDRVEMPIDAADYGSSVVGTFAITGDFLVKYITKYVGHYCCWDCFRAAPVKCPY